MVKWLPLPEPMLMGITRSMILILEPTQFRITARDHQATDLMVQIIAD